mmetsp:Transcript_21381/g.36448  ORF Transcript_21381/g.36448 Transcript_21381/m.36448 type:complete len:219 (+) Transcript_21381:179-835(+)
MKTECEYTGTYNMYINLDPDMVCSYQLPHANAKRIRRTRTCHHTSHGMPHHAPAALCKAARTWGDVESLEYTLQHPDQSHHMTVIRATLGLERLLRLSTLPFLGFPPSIDQLNNHRHHAHSHNGQHHQCEVLLNKRQVSEEKACPHEENCPQDSPPHVVHGKLFVWHAADTGNKGRKRADNGDEARQHHCLAPVLRVKLLRLVDVLTLHQPAVHGPGA